MSLRQARITSSGLRKPVRIDAQKGEIHYIRERAHIVEEALSDALHLRVYDYETNTYQVRRMERWIAEDLFAMGDAKRREDMTAWATRMGRTVDPEDLPGYNVGDVDAWCELHLRGTILVDYLHGDNDSEGWNHASQLGSVGGCYPDENGRLLCWDEAGDDVPMMLEIRCTRKIAQEIAEGDDYRVIKPFDVMGR